MDFFIMFVKMIVALIVVLGLLVLIFKVANNRLNIVGTEKYMKVIDRLQVTKDSSLIVVKIGDKGVVLFTSNKGVDKLYEISKEEIEKIQEDKKKALENMSNRYNSFFKKLNEKTFNRNNKKILKEEYYEKK